MSIPEFQSLMLPLLKLLSDEQEYAMREIIETLAWEFSLTDDQKQKLLPSGQQSVFDNRVGWARTYLKKAGLVKDPRKGFVKITARGVEDLQQKPKAINKIFLSQYPEFGDFQNNSKQTNFDWTNNDDWADDLEEDDWKEEEELEEELNSDLEIHQFSASICNMRKELLKLVNNKAQHTLLIEG